MTFLEEKGDATWSMPYLISFLSELLGTALLMLIGCAGCYDTYELGPLLPGLSFGAAVLIAIQVTNHISPCHMNPAISLGFLIMNQMHWLRFLVYLFAQYIGAFVGYGILWCLAPKNIFLCLLKVELGNVWQGFGFEFVGTMALVLVVFGATDLKCANYIDSKYIRIAFAVGGVVICIATFTGAGINPARALPPAILIQVWKDHWVYQVAPLAGAAFAAIIYRFILSDTEQYSLNTWLNKKGSSSIDA